MIILTKCMFAQTSTFDSTKYSPVIIDGKEGYLEIETGKIFYGDHARNTISTQQENGSTPLVENNQSVSLNHTSKNYTVQKGDTFYGIARRFNLKPVELARLNNMALSTPLKVNQVLVVENRGSNTTQRFSGIDASHYIVRKGDTLYSIARTYGITVYELKQINDLRSSLIHVNQELKVR